MKYFTYKDYIKCIHTLRLNSIMKLAESMETYNIRKNNEANLYKRLCTNLLKNPKHLSEFLSEFLKSDIEIEENNLKPYTNDFMDKKIKSNLTYKLANTDIFFVIQCTEKSNNKVIYTLLDTCIDIMRKYCQTRKESDLLRLPVIIPIIVYIGDDKWDVYDERDNKYKSDYRTSELSNLNLKYNLYNYRLLDNKVSEKKKSLFEKILSIKKSEKNIVFINEVKDSKFSTILNKNGKIGEIQEVVLENIIKRLE